MEKPIVFTGNSIEALIAQLQNTLLCSRASPANQWILLPDLALRDPLTKHLQKGKRAASLDPHFHTLEHGVHNLFFHTTGKTLDCPPPDLLSLHLEALILEGEEEFKADPLFPHFAGESRSGARALASDLAREFSMRGTLEKAHLRTWLETTGWRQILWKKAFSDWNAPHELLDASYHRPEIPTEAHLFLFPFLPELYHRFLQKIALQIPIFYYQFSPCKEFWTDTLSDRERLFLQRERGEERELDLYLKEHNQLLVNFGMLARSTFRFFEEGNFPLEESYRDPPSSLLGEVQSDILNDSVRKPRPFPSDSSLLIYGASSALEEIERLYATLSTLPYPPSEIQIFAPDISPYAPYIELLFGSKRSPFPFQIHHLPQSYKSSLPSALFELLSLPDRRFDRQSIFTLLSHPHMAPPFRFSEKEIDTLSSLMERLGVRWGIEPEHRIQLLPNSTCERGGTWECAFEQLLNPQPPSTLWELPPLLPETREMIERLISTLRSLKRDLDRTKRARTLQSWCALLLSLIETHFSVPEQESAALDTLKEKLSSLRILHKKVPRALFSLPSILKFLQNGAEERRASLTSRGQSLTFRSLKSGALLPAKAICLLGMHEGNFPRPATAPSMQHARKSHPSPSDEDRSLFLELLSTAKEQLIISYLARDERDGGKRAPSPVVGELLAYIESHYQIEEGALAPTSHATSIPPTECDALDATTPFIPEFSTPHPLPEAEEEDEAISLKDLSLLAKHPIRFYFQKTLKIPPDFPRANEEFELSPLCRTVLQKKALSSPLDELIRESANRGKLPSGRWREVASFALKEEVRTMKNALQELGIEEVFSLPISLPLSLPRGKNILLKGVIDRVTSRGLLFFEERRSLIKIWPQFLLFCCFAENPCEKKLLLVKEGRALALPDPETALKRLLSYRAIALRTPSPFLPIWHEIFLHKTARELEKGIAQTIARGRDPYVNSAFSHSHAPAIFATWTPYLRNAFQEFAECRKKGAFDAPI